MIAEVPYDTMMVSPDGRLPHIVSLLRSATGSELCCGIEEITFHSALASADEGAHGIWFPLQRGQAPRTLRNGGSFQSEGPPPKRQRQADFQSALLASVEGFAGRLAALEVGARDSRTHLPIWLPFCTKQESPILSNLVWIVGSPQRRPSTTMRSTTAGQARQAASV